MCQLIMYLKLDLFDYFVYIKFNMSFYIDNSYIIFNIKIWEFKLQIILYKFKFEIIDIEVKLKRMFFIVNWFIFLIFNVRC